ncbi:UNVERIFIED_CONTAM: hypothetical protein RMT77_001302 [Armadillidium vulgare]
MFYTKVKRILLLFSWIFFGAIQFCGALNKTYLGPYDTTIFEQVVPDKLEGRSRSTKHETFEKDLNLPNLFKKLDLIKSRYEALHERASNALYRITVEQQKIKSKSENLEVKFIKMDGVSKSVENDMKSIRAMIQESANYLKHIKKELDDSLERHFHIFKKDILNSIFMYQSSVECPMDTFRFGPTCVSFQSGEKTWDEWRQFCTNLNGDIVKLEYRELPLSILLKVLPALKQTVVTTLEIGSSLNIYVGAEDKDGKGDWKWISKSRLPLDDPRWLFKEPNLPPGSGRHCLSIKIQRLSTTSYNVGLDDISCGLKLGALCEHQRIY